jgi:hypothetical protein
LYRQLYGGIVVTNAESARVIIADPENPAFLLLKKKYHITDKHVEPTEWVMGTIQKKRREHDQPPLKKMPGRPPGSR